MPTQPAPKAPTSLRITRIRLVFLALTLAVVLPAADASAQGRRARLSKDLSDKISTGDASNSSVIVTGTQSAVDSLAARHGLRISKRLRTGAVIDVPAGSLEAVANDAGVDVISGNQVLQSNMAVTTTAIGADQAWEGLVGGAGVTGSGVGVAVIDSGIANVNALRGRVAASLDFTDDRGKGIDKNGHGTHVAGIIAAAGSGQQSDVSGVAPGAHLVSLKVLDENGRGTADLVIEAIDWVVANHARYGIRIINMSLGGAVLQSWQDDPICQAVERAYDADITVVASAGNFGKAEDGTPIFGGITVPGNCPHSITVGALNTKGTAFRSDDEVATYSSRGPTRFDGLVKPDVVAPGNRILGLAVPGSTLVREHPELVVGHGTNAQLVLSGASMATAVVSGAVAQLVEQSPNVKPTGVRFRLQYSASPLSAGQLTGGSGSVNVLAALKLSAGDDVLETLIAGESVSVGGLLSAHRVIWQDARNILWGNAADNILWGNARNILWGNATDNILWGSAADNILWGNASNILWGNARNILWGNASNILWGNASNILWGNASNILWGNASNILWGNASNILWGNASNILWGNASNILWGNANNILWGNADNILWGNANNILWGNASNILWGNSALLGE